MNPARPRGRGQAPAGGGLNGAIQRLGWPFIILLVWLVFEVGRPARPFGIPLLISWASLGLWVVRKDKQLGPHGWIWFALLVAMLIQVPIAANGFSAYNATRGMLILFMCICLPLLSLVTSLENVRVWIYTFLATCFYVGAFAALNGGYGPAGAMGGQDENYVSALMCMAIPFSYFLMFNDKRTIARLIHTVSIIVFVAAIALAGNPSRGAFLALCAVAAYCLWRSPRKAMGLGILSVGGIAMLVVAGEAFWAEIGTSADFETGTADLRIQAWTAGLRMFAANPVIGVGPGNFGWELGNFESTAQIAELGRSMGGSMVAHSLWVELLAEWGLLGVLGTLTLVFGTVRGLEKILRDTAPRIREATPGSELGELRCYAYALECSILAISVNGVFLSLLYYWHLWHLVVLGTALAFISRRILAQGQGPAQRPARGGARGRPRGQRTLRRGPPVMPQTQARRRPLGPNWNQP